MYERIPVWLACRKRKEVGSSSGQRGTDITWETERQMGFKSERQGDIMLSNKRNNIKGNISTDQYRKSEWRKSHSRNTETITPASYNPQRHNLQAMRGKILCYDGRQKNKKLVSGQRSLTPNFLHEPVPIWTFFFSSYFLFHNSKNTTAFIRCLTRQVHKSQCSAKKKQLSTELLYLALTNLKWIYLYIPLKFKRILVHIHLIIRLD